MKRIMILGALLFLCLLARPALAAELTGTFSVKQSKGLGLSEGDKITVRMSITPGAPAEARIWAGAMAGFRVY